MVVRVKTVIVRFQPPETYGGLVSNIVNPVLNEFSHLLILDSDTVCDFSVDNIAKQFGVADIVGFNVISSSRTFRLWEKMTYWSKLSPHVRGCAMAQFPPRQESNDLAGRYQYKLEQLKMYITGLGSQIGRLKIIEVAGKPPREKERSGRPRMSDCIGHQCNHQGSTPFLRQGFPLDNSVRKERD